MNNIKVPEKVKQLIKKFTKPDKKLSSETEEVNEVEVESGHQAVETGPKPGTLGILLYYLSLSLCMVGVLLILRTSYVKVSVYQFSCMDEHIFSKS